MTLVMLNQLRLDQAAIQNVTMRTVVVVVGLLAVGCRSEHEPPAKAVANKPATKIGTRVVPGTLKRAQVETGYGVAVGADADMAMLKKLAPDALERKFAEVFSDNEVFVMTHALKPDDVEQLKTSTVLLLHGESANGLELAHDLATKAHELAVAAHGWVLDPDALFAYPADEFVEHIPGDHLDVRKLIAVHAVGGTGEVPFLDTAGLRRYGYPELYIAQVGEAQVDGATTLLNAVAQTLVAGGDVGPRGTITVEPKKLGWNFDEYAGGTGKATFTTRWALEPDDDDENNAVIELIPAAGATSEGWAKAVNECFGSKPEQVVGLKADDPELLDAANKTRASIVKLRPHFKDGVPYNERLIVKAKFSNDDGRVEWMWVDVVTIKDDVLSGTLQNTPDFVTSVRLGQKVNVRLADIGDYLYQQRDGSSEGGYTEAIMKKRGLLPSE